MKESTYSLRSSPSVVRGSPTRPLGAVRTSSSQPNVPKFPPLQLDRSYDGIHGNAMAVPPHRETQEREEKIVKSPVRTVRRSSSQSDTGSSKSTHSDRELKEALVREKEIKQQVMALQKIIDGLKMQILDKEKIISELHLQFASQEERYKELFEKEVASHKVTQTDLDDVRSELGRLTEEMMATKERHAEEMTALETRMTQQLKDLEAEKAKEIAEKDEKLSRLKNQMADALKGNSWERQQQLDELTKELSRVQDECDTLRLSLKNLAKNSSSSCANCESSAALLSESRRTVEDRDKIIRDLKAPSNKNTSDITLLQLTDRKSLTKPRK